MWWHRCYPGSSTYLDELLHALAHGGIVDVLLLGSKVGELRLGDGLRIGGDVRGGHSGVDGGDATVVPRRADLVSTTAIVGQVVFGVAGHSHSHC